MVSRRSKAALLAVVGLILATNSIWLFPNAGQTEYTYERSELTVENGTITYGGVDNFEFREWNQLEPVGCQWHDSDGERACAFDEHLVDNPPVTASRQMAWGRITPDFVELDGAYYRRIHRPNDSNVTHDVEPVSPETVLAESASNVTDRQVPDRGTVPLEYYIAVSGETVTSFEELERDDLGRIYLQNGTYYTVVGTNESVNHPGPDIRRYQALRYVLAFVGVVLLLMGTHMELTREGD